MKKEKFAQWYNHINLILTMAWIALFLLDLSKLINIDHVPYIWLDIFLWSIFIIDYIVRFIYAKDKKKFFTSNIFDLIAIIPLGWLKIGSFTRVNRLFKVIGLFGKLAKNKESILYKNGFIYAVYISAMIVFIGSGLFSIAENKSYGESLWWSIVTVTTVGYGGIIPTTVYGKLIATVTMIFGIGFIGFMTSAITNYVKDKNTSTEETKNNLEIEELRQQLVQLNKKMDRLLQEKEKSD